MEVEAHEQYISERLVILCNCSRNMGGRVKSCEILCRYSCPHGSNGHPSLYLDPPKALCADTNRPGFAGEGPEHLDCCAWRGVGYIWCSGVRDGWMQ